jgi:hypothetical protein
MDLPFFEFILILYQTDDALTGHTEHRNEYFRDLNLRSLYPKSSNEDKETTYRLSTKKPLLVLPVDLSTIL